MEVTIFTSNMVTLQKARQRVENKQYIFPSEELSQQVKRLKIPRGYLVELTYRKPKPEEVQARSENDESALPSQLVGIVDFVESTGGLSSDTVEEMEEHFQEFKTTFDI